MKIFRHIIISTFINGTVGCWIFLFYSWLKFGFNFSTGILILWGIGLGIAGLFNVLVSWSVLRFSVFKKSMAKSIVAGSFSGLVAVFGFFALVSHYPLNLEYMFYRLWLYYLIFFIMGGLYGYLHYRDYKA